MSEDNIRLKASASSKSVSADFEVKYHFLISHHLDELYDIMGEDFFSLMQIYFPSIDKLLSDLEIAVIEEDYDGLHNAAHTIKSLSSQVGAAEVALKADKIEQIAIQKGCFYEVSYKLFILKKNVEQANIELKQYIDSKNKVA